MAETAVKSSLYRSQVTSGIWSWI